MALIQDLEGDHELGAEKSLAVEAIGEVREVREGIHHDVLAHVVPETAREKTETETVQFKCNINIEFRPAG